MGVAAWQHCQFHLGQNSIHYAPNMATRKRIGVELRHIWNAPDLDSANENLRRLIESYRDTVPKLAAWLEDNVPEGGCITTFGYRFALL